MKCPNCGFDLFIGETNRQYEGLCFHCFERECARGWAKYEEIEREAHQATGEPRTTCVIEGNAIKMIVAP